MVVCVKAGEVAKKLVRRGYRLAKRLQGQFWVVHVHTPGETLGRRHAELEDLFELARSLGGNVAELSGDNEADAILHFAREHRATFIIMGQSKRSRAQEVLRGSTLIARIMRETDDIDVLAVADPSKASEDEAGSRRRRSPTPAHRPVAAASPYLQRAFMVLNAGRVA